MASCFAIFVRFVAKRARKGNLLNGLFDFVVHLVFLLVLPAAVGALVVAISFKPAQHALSAEDLIAVVVASSLDTVEVQQFEADPTNVLV